MLSPRSQCEEKPQTQANSEEPSFGTLTGGDLTGGDAGSFFTLLGDPGGRPGDLLAGGASLSPSDSFFFSSKLNPFKTAGFATGEPF